jgi:hypothetical protein
VAALTVYDMVKAVDKSAVIESVRLLAKSGGKSGDYRRDGASRSDQAKNVAAPSPPGRPKHANTKKQPAKPRVLMGEVAATRPPAAPHAQRDAFRTFMTSHRLRATQWAKDAGVPLGEIMAFLTGRSPALSSDTAAKLASAARVRAEDLFR